MKGFPEEFDSIFRYIEVVSQRAAQLIQGAHPRLETNRSKSTLQARDEVDTNMVSWRVLTQEELEARRQALVEQFRAEMTPEGEAQEGTEPTDVLPTRAAPAPVIETETETETPSVEEGDRDDDLMRLQRLIGFGGDAPSPAEEKPEGDETPEQDAEEHVED